MNIEEYDKIEETFWAWLAGFTDGDGCFTIGIKKNHSKKDKLTRFAVDPRLCLTQKTDNNHVLFFVEKVLGGKVYISNTSPKSQWIISRFEYLLYICNKLLPYLKVKDRQCKLMIKLIQLKLSFPHSTIKNSRMPKDILIECIDIAIQISNFNGKSKWKSINFKDLEFWKKQVDYYYSKDEEIISKRIAQKYITLICENCGKTFDRLKCNIDKKTKMHFCSRKCINMYQGNHKCKTTINVK